MKGQMIGSSDSKRRVGFLFQSFSLTSSIYHRENVIYSGRSGVQGSDGLSRRSKSSRKEESLDPSDACVFDWAQSNWKAWRPGPEKRRLRSDVKERRPLPETSMRFYRRACEPASLPCDVKSLPQALNLIEAPWPFWGWQRLPYARMRGKVCPGHRSRRIRANSK